MKTNIIKRSSIISGFVPEGRHLLVIVLKLEDIRIIKIKRQESERNWSEKTPTLPVRRISSRINKQIFRNLGSNLRIRKFLFYFLSPSGTKDKNKEENPQDIPKYSDDFPYWLKV